MATMLYNGIRVIVCIPAFNEARSIANVIAKAKPYATEIIVCDDGSSDGTAEVAGEAGARIIKHPFNKGYGEAIKTLFAAARESQADVMVTLDSDGQHDAGQIPTIVAPILQGSHDIVIGSRFLTETDRQEVPFYRSVGIKTITKLTHAVSYNHITDAQSGFRAYSKEALANIKLTQKGMAVSTEILIRAKEKGLPVTEVPVTISYDVEDSSTHNPVSHALTVVSSIIKYISLRHPLAFFGISGLILLTTASFFGGNALSLFLRTNYTSTNMLVISIGLSAIGVTLIATGLILYTLMAINREKKII
jgi:glycosyltransferase involved in cell wall biosynthesis